jgi:hypothetical protein
LWLKECCFRLRGSWGYSSTLSLTLALEGDGWLTLGPSALPPRKRPGTLYIGGLVGPKAGPDFDFRTVQPLHQLLRNRHGSDISFKYVSCQMSCKFKTSVNEDHLLRSVCHASDIPVSFKFKSSRTTEGGPVVCIQGAGNPMSVFI